MTLKDMKEKTYRLIEELSEDTAQSLTDDPDYEKKINTCINVIQNELARIKKIPAYKEIEVDIDIKDIYNFSDIQGTDENKVYQLSTIKGINNEKKAKGTIIKCLENGIMEVDYFKYPIEIEEDTNDNTYEFELSQDVLEIMPFGVAGDMLKTDVSTNYGAYFSSRYNELKQGIDPRYSLGNIYIDTGVYYE